MPDIDLDSQRIEPEAPGEQSWLDETNRDSLTIKIKVHPLSTSPKICCQPGEEVHWLDPHLSCL